MTTEPRQPVRRLRPGDRVRLVSPCSPPDPVRVDVGVRMLNAWGLQVQVDPFPTGAQPYDPVHRAAAVQRALADPSVHAVLVTRAGTGARDLLPLLDFSVLEQLPKPLCGFSDVTLLHEAIGAATRRPSFHTPELAWNSRLNGDHSRDSLRALLMGDGPALRARHGVVPSRGPAVSGRLRGGNLSTLARLDAAGTRPGDVLFLEEFRETPGSIATLLAGITERGHATAIRGVVLGQFVDCGDPERVAAVLEAWCEQTTSTVLAGVPAGHGQAQESIALGWTVIVDPPARRMSYPSSPTDPELQW